ncbi:hypothetical protein HWV62_17376 [Athelia sp. TMB]|nr:hypothetical protein HWV62_17376 [Athelia sp. TMB]
MSGQFDLRKTRSGREFSEFRPIASIQTALSVDASLIDAIHREDVYYYFGQPLDGALSPLTPLPSCPPSPGALIPPHSPALSSCSSLGSFSSASSGQPGSCPPSPSLPPQPSYESLLDALTGFTPPSGSLKRKSVEAMDEESVPSAPAGHKRKRKRYESDKLAATERRRARRAAQPPTARAPHEKLLNKRKEAPMAIETALNALSDLPLTSTGYIGRRTKAIRPGEVWELQELKDDGFEVYDWDGLAPVAILDHARRIVAMLVGRPARPPAGKADTWDEAVEAVTAAIAQARGQFSFADGDLEHRRGNFPARLFGVSHGGGQTSPCVAKQSSKENVAVLEELRLNPSLNRIAGFGSAAFAFYAPKLWRHYANTFESLYSRDAALRWNFNSSIFPCATINFGPQTVCFDHIDNGNAAAGWCDIFAMGDYNPQKGGHLILFDIKKVIVFPPGSHVLIPSSLMRHGNTPISKGETRMGFTQYAAGGLFRWVKNDFQTVENCSKQDPVLHAKLAAAAETRFATLLTLYSKLDDLVQDRKMAFGCDKGMESKT